MCKDKFKKICYWIERNCYLFLYITLFFILAYIFLKNHSVTLFPLSLATTNFNPDFYKASFIQILTLVIAVTISYFATQYKSDLRKHKENAEKLIDKILFLVTDTDFYKFDKVNDFDLEKKRMSLRDRRISNSIEVLFNYTKKMNFGIELTYIKEQFKEYKKLVSDNLDLSKLIEIEDQLLKYSYNIESKCDVIKSKIYL